MINQRYLDKKYASDRVLNDTGLYIIKKRRRNTLFSGQRTWKLSTAAWEQHVLRQS